MARSKKTKKRQPIANSKVFWVILLALISFSFAFDPSMVMSPDPVHGTVFGQEITRSQVQAATSGLEAVHRVAMLSNTTASYRFFGNLVRSDPREFLAYLEEAKRVGIRVSDEELAELRRELWRGLRASEIVSKENPAAEESDDARMQAQIRRYELLESLRTNKVFDRRDWGEKVRALTRLPTVTFEEALRDALTVAKLEEYVLSSVVVPDPELWEEYQRQDEKRKGSWVALEPTPELETALRASFTDEDLRAHLEVNADEFRQGQAISAEYLIVPREHFASEIAASLTEEDLRSHYEATKESYRRPGIPVDPGFELLTAEEMEARERENILPFEEAKEQVREKLIADRSNAKARELANALRDRLQVKDAQGNLVTGATFEELVDEHPFLVAGSVRPTTRVDARRDFGAAYSPIVASWFTTAQRDGDLSSAQRSRLLEPSVLSDETGFAFYRNVRVLEPRVPELDEIRDKVADSLYQSRVIDVLENAAREQAEAISAGSASLDALAGTTVAVKITDGVEANARFATLESTPELIGRRDTIRLPAEEPENAEDGDDDSHADDADDHEGHDHAAEDAKEPERKVHPASSALIGALFAIEEQGDATVARAIDGSRAFVVTYAERAAPDSGGFADRKSQIRSRLLRERQEKAFMDWVQDVRQRAFAQLAQGTVVEGEESAQ